MPDRRDRDAGIAELVAAGEARARQVEEPVLVLEDQAAALGIGDPVAIAGKDRRAEPAGIRLDHVHHRSRLRRHHHRTAPLDDPGLLAGDLRQRVAEEFLVVHRDRRDRRDQRIVDDVGRIVAAAEADLEEREVGRVIGEEEDGGGGGDLELRDRGAAIDALDLEQRLDQRLLVDEAPAAPPAEADALMEADEMRRGVDVRGLAGGLDHRAQECGGRALAVGAGDVDDRRHPALRVAELVHEHAHPVEREVDLARIERLEALEDGARTFHAFAVSGLDRLEQGRQRLALGHRRRRGGGRGARSSRAAGGGGRPGRPCRGRGDTPPAGTLPAASRGWSAR